MTAPAYIVGIDLGTTNTVVAYAAITDDVQGSPEINLFPITQLTDSGVVEKRPLLPSFILIPGGHDVASQALALPWKADNALAVGEFAKNRGAELPGRLIASSKSWLCHTLVDRSQAILPWESTHTEAKKSPVEASAAILEHIRDAWNHEMASEDPDLALENQEILLTVPASFDAVARELTVQAAQLAGLTHITLLEEPQAAFYAWIEAGAAQWREKIQVGDLVLVCDVGGGTTDFSLIQVSEEQGELALERIAVGQHLLVGGDNMDLALAHSLARQLSDKGQRLDGAQMRGLWHGCRNAKEKILGNRDLDEVPVTILGRGSSLIGGTIKAPLNRETVDQILLEGFFPYCESDVRPKTQHGIGLQEIGLAYASDPAVTYHLAQFLAQNQGAGKPTAVLFNGGVMKAGNVRRRVMEILGAWRESDADGSVRALEAADFDLAVARGAAYYGLARRGRGIRIRYGLNKSYYVGIAASMPAVPGLPAPIKALCVAPFGMEEGSQASLEGREFALVVGAPAKFDFLGSMRHDDPVGTVVEDWEGEIKAIAAIETTLDGEAGQVIPVTLESRVTEVGTLELWCVAKEDQRRWKLEFNVREMEALEP
jgi:molecular chaperone DnaK (HSP70)